MLIYQRFPVMNCIYHIPPPWHDIVFNVFESHVLIRLNSRKLIGIYLALKFSFCFLFSHKTITSRIFINTFCRIATGVQLMLWGQKKMCASGFHDLYTQCITELFNKLKTTNAKCFPYPHGIKHLKIQFIFRFKNSFLGTK